MTDEQKKKFERLACALSPENLYCDGECSHREAMRKQKKLVAEWRKLEKEVGRRVSEYEV